MIGINHDIFSPVMIAQQDSLHLAAYIRPLGPPKHHSVQILGTAQADPPSYTPFIRCM